MIRIFVYLFAFFIVFYLYVVYLEKNALFFPEKQITIKPSDAGLRYEEVYLRTSDNVRIHGWYIPSKRNAPTLLYLHGNAGNMSDRVHKLAMFYNMGLNVFIIDYRGYGNSSGNPTEQGMYLDSTAAYQYLINERKINSDKLIVFGASLGGVAAIDLANRYPFGGLVIDSSFSSAVDMAHALYPFIPSFMLSIKMDNIKKIQNFTAPKLFMHSKNDEIVPYYLGRQLFDAAPQPKSFLDLRGSHMNSHLEDESNYISGMELFLKKYGLD